MTYRTRRLIAGGLCVALAVALLLAWRHVASRSESSLRYGADGRRANAVSGAVDVTARGLSHSRFNKDGREIARIEADAARIVAPKVGPLRFGPVRIVEARNLHVTLFGGDVGILGQTVDEAVGGMATGKPIVGLRASGVRLTLLDDDGRLRCELIARRSDIDLRGTPGRHAVDLEGRVVVKSPDGRRLHAKKARVDPESTIITVPGGAMLFADGKRHALASYQGDCSLDATR